MKTIAFTFILLILAAVSFGQRKSTYYKRESTYSIKQKPTDGFRRKTKSNFKGKPASNGIFGNIGGFPMVGSNWSIYYERIVYSKFPRPFLRTGYGLEYYHERIISHYMLQAGVFLGRKSSNFEIAIGAMYAPETDPQDNPYFVSGSVGYRYQKPNGGIIFRTGVGIPELAYVGLGLSF